MPKLIKKYQSGTWGYKPSTFAESTINKVPQYLQNSLDQSIKESKKKLNPLFSNGKMNMDIFNQTKNLKIEAPQYKGLGSNLLESSSSTGTISGKGMAGIGKFGKANADLLGAVPDMGEAVAKSLGAKEATIAAPGALLYKQATSALLKGSLQSGNPYAIAGAAFLKGTDILNRYAGVNTAKQGTLGLDTGGYASLINPNAGQKTTLTNRGKGKGIDATTKKMDMFNLKAGRSAYDNSRDQLAAGNSFMDVGRRNEQQQAGGLDTRMFSAKNGAKINPKKLSNIKKKAQHNIKKAQEGSMAVNVTTLQKGGLFKTNPVAYVDSVLNANKHLDFIQRFYNPTQSIPSPYKKGDFSTHLMSYDPGSRRVYPTIVNINGKLQHLSKPDEAWNYADKTKEYIEFPTAEEAKWFANSTDNTSGYKMGSGVLGNNIKHSKPIGPAELALGGKINVIPEGALHAHKNHYDGDLAEQVTSKGIPVISYEEGDKITQHAEIERNEVIFHIDTTKQLESWFKEYNDTEDTKKKAELEIECGKFLVEEILENTLDNTGLLTEIE